MAAPTLKLPVIQNWSCHNCGGCCREHLIEITQDEKTRIDQQGWSVTNDIPADRPPVVAHGTGWRLNHQDDGACVFLNSDGLCRIHARFGEDAKPLACRVYPFAVHPDGKALTVSLRFSCPSVVQNVGTPVRSRPDLPRLAAEITAGRKTETTPPAVHGAEHVEWGDIDRFVGAFDESLADESVHLAVRLMRILTWLELVEQSTFAKVRGPRLDEYLSTMVRAARRAQPDNELPVLQPSRLGRVMFRLLVAQLLRHDTAESGRTGMWNRIRLLRDGIRFTGGWGRIPRIPVPPSVAVAFGDAEADLPQHVRFRSVERPFCGRNEQLDALMTRYLRVKVQGLHFCGAANFGMNVVDGFRALALMYPATQYIARVKAAAAGREALSLPDIQTSLATLDHNFGYSPALGTKAAIDRIRQLAKLQQVTRLCGWYSL